LWELLLGKAKKKGQTPPGIRYNKFKVKRKNASRDIEGKERVIINHRGLLGRTPQWDFSWKA
jgi:hypothetical protein